MGSVKLKDLKAYVRYDGSGRVVSGSLVFRKKKPKNGRWVEIPKNLCCNGNPSSTTTTTTQGGGAPTAWVTYIAGNQENACAQTSGWNFVLYTAGSTLGAGVVLYTDATLTTEFNSYQYASILYNNGTLYQLSDLPNDGTIVSVIGACPTTTTTTTLSFGNAGFVSNGISAVCNNQGQFNLPLSIDPNACSNGGITLTSGTYPDYGIPNGSNIYINLQDGNVIQVQTFGSNQMSFGCTSCPTTTTTTTFNPFEPTTTTTTTQSGYTIGQQALGGVIAYILQPGDPGYDPNVQHGLVATVNDVSDAVAAGWGCFGQFISNASNTAIGAGSVNTDSIVNQCADNGAARICFDLVQGGYSDWVLPSSNELVALWNNRFSIGGFGNQYYWSSTQGDSGAGEADNAYVLFNNSGNIFNIQKFADNMSVRAIRYF